MYSDDPETLLDASKSSKSPLEVREGFSLSHIVMDAETLWSLDMLENNSIED